MKNCFEVNIYLTNAIAYLFRKKKFKYLCLHNLLVNKKY
ncbi:hypothetical protein A1OE_486 [Candidatus Endolissoclinum faulkneri L2]|uniref:Uncharacterized protein n=1 Tax=Candidatus Endolissoclinum faulkneri L2 TaxID=1193729 RepID=K7YQ20_9PROT|nr:hypothetical protein A1OE_486 [Candidatus Endolissoclinum faulkneri L2]